MKVDRNEFSNLWTLIKNAEKYTFRYDEDGNAFIDIKTNAGYIHTIKASESHFKG